MITEKNKEQFEKWYEKDYRKINLVGSYHFFKRLPFEMQIGVYLAYYDSLGIYIEFFMFETPSDWSWKIYGEDIMSPLFKITEGDIIEPSNSRNEAYKEAFKKVDELINNE